MVTVDRAPKISRMGEIGCRDCRSEATAEKRCLGLRVRVRGRLCGWNPRSRGGSTGSSNGIFILGSSRNMV